MNSRRRAAGRLLPLVLLLALVVGPPRGFHGGFTLPAGAYEYKVALNLSWDENYGAGGVRDGGNLSLTAPGGAVHFAYDSTTHWIGDSVNGEIVTVPGSYQSELGCAGDWDPSCLKSWLEDPDEDGTYIFETTSIPPGSYEAKVAINESWDENYGQGGAPGGANIPFNVSAAGQKVTFSYNASTHVLDITAGAALGDIQWDGLRHD